MGTGTRVVVVEQLESFANELARAGDDILALCESCKGQVQELTSLLEGHSTAQFEEWINILNTTGSGINERLQAYANFVRNDVVARTVETEQSGAQAIAQANEALASSIRSN